MTEIFHMDNLDSRAQNVVYDVLHYSIEKLREAAKLCHRSNECSDWLLHAPVSTQLKEDYCNVNMSLFNIIVNVDCN